ncbi:hypothetical protein [Halanaerobium hydrogeniformans]|uniref:Uncharacterized protein n=1 Tax=Halanaerobium hydrogeniformans TaxID=656519 RepID=E4RME7_HALHG|nr:hypothetical protein [Halanaerobium hydrogeniformans]ADQ14478.1 hypothetical protein Halsa_1038 [Halanaerobium hydrogeniformans]
MVRKNEKFASDSILGIQIDNNICFKCIRVYKNGFTCDAFSEGIPREILNGSFDHRKNHPDDNGLKFKLNEFFAGED